MLQEPESMLELWGGARVYAAGARVYASLVILVSVQVPLVFGLDFGTFDFGTFDLGLTIQVLSCLCHTFLLLLSSCCIMHFWISFHPSLNVHQFRHMHTKSKTYCIEGLSGIKI